MSEPPVIGIDLGGTKIAAAIGRHGEFPVSIRCVPTEHDRGPDHVLAKIATLIQQLEEQTNHHAEAIGIGVPGLVDVDCGITRFLPNLATQWRDIPVANLIAARTHRPVRVLNDARLACLGELSYGAGRDNDSFILLTIGTGIGGGVVLDRKLRLGRYGSAGEIGHQTLVADGQLCTCGNRGCVETLCGSNALTGEGAVLMAAGLAPRLAALCEMDSTRVTPLMMAQAAREGDVAIRSALDRAARYLGIAVANLVVTLGIELIVLTGGMSALGETLTAPMLDVVRERVHVVPVDNVRIICSSLGANAGVLGGIALATEAARVASVRA